MSDLFQAKESSTMMQLLRTRTFWITTAVVTSASLMLYDWYSDRYASPSTRFTQIEGDCVIPIKKLSIIRKEFIREMKRGLSEDDSLPTKEKQSCLKMLSSHVQCIPNGLEHGVFYALDWGGTNFRVLRIEFASTKKGQKPISPIYSESKSTIDTQYLECTNSEALFDDLASKVSNKLAIDCCDPSFEYPVGFTFSFPMAQPSLNTGVLVEWTKGFNIPSVVGKDVVGLMQKAFIKHNINLKIHAVCNDTVGTLLSCAYHHDNVRVGLIIGTGSNACYIDPQINGGEIINIEWGGFGEHIEFTRMAIDFIMDEYTTNPGHQYAEKMISGHYLGELVRLVAITVFRQFITDYGKETPLNFKWQFKSEIVSHILKLRFNHNLDAILHLLRGETVGLKHFTYDNAMIFAKICELIVNRSADLAATLLLGTLEKTGLYICKTQNKHDLFQLTDQYANDPNKIVTVGIDGSVYQHVPRYQYRMEYTIRNVVGDEVAKRIRLVRASDGSGKGAALAVAAALSN